MVCPLPACGQRRGTLRARGTGEVRRGARWQAAATQPEQAVLDGLQRRRWQLQTEQDQSPFTTLASPVGARGSNRAARHRGSLLKPLTRPTLHSCSTKHARLPRGDRPFLRLLSSGCSLLGWVARPCCSPPPISAVSLLTTTTSAARATAPPVRPFTAFAQCSRPFDQQSLCFPLQSMP